MEQYLLEFIIIEGVINTINNLKTKELQPIKLMVSKITHFIWTIRNGLIKDIKNHTWPDFLVFLTSQWKHQLTDLRKSKVIQLVDFKGAYLELKQDSGYKFSDEFFELKEIGKDQSVEASLLPANRGKNRYTNILSYDKTRGKFTFNLHPELKSALC